VALTTAEGRARLLRETWGHLPRRQRLRKLIRSGITGTPPVPLETERVDAIMALFAIIYALVAEIIDLVTDAHRRRRYVRCYGARAHGLSPKGIRLTYGVVEGDPTPSPLRAEPCLAYAISLRARNPIDPARDVLWREAAAPSSFAVRLDDGQTVRVPAGPIWFEAHRETARGASVERARQRLPPDLRGTVQELAFVPYDEALEDLLRPGDSVVLASELARVEDRSAPRVPLRHPAPAVLLAASPVVLHKM
jgi:hypothetical protein